jgi:integrase
MTVNDAVKHIKEAVGENWPTQKPIPTDLVGILCDALWDAGLPPRINVVRKYFDKFHDRAFAPGVHAWQAARGFDHTFPRWANPHVSGPDALAKRLWPAIAHAPQTCLDPTNDGRWAAPHPKIVVYLCGIENESLRNLLSLYALIKVALGQHPLYSRLSGYSLPLQKLLEEQGLDSVYKIDPDDLLFKICEGKAGTTLTEHQRSWIVLSWNGLYNAFQGYAEGLSPVQLEAMSPYFVRPLENRYRMNRQRPSILIRDRAREKVKVKSDVVHAQFHKLRFLARVRCNQARRLFEAVDAAIADVVANRRSLPWRFGYEETIANANARPLRQRVLLTLWDSSSLWDHALSLGHKVSNQSKIQRARVHETGRFSRARKGYHVQYRGVEPVGDSPRTEEFWFLDLYEHHVFYLHPDSEALKTRTEFFEAHGYESRLPWTLAPGLLKPLRRHIGYDAVFLERKHNYRFLHYEGIYAASLFGHLVVRMQTVTGARIGEVQQIAQNPECIKQLVNVGPKASTRWLLRLVAKGRKERCDYFIDEDTKDVLMEVLSFQRARMKVKKLPVVAHESIKYPADRYVLQWNRKPLGQDVLNTALRFLLHGAVLGPEGGCVHLTTHLLRHGFATEMASLKVPVDVIAKILHQRNLDVTRYYSRPTNQQVMDAAEIIFVDRIDVAGEALRNPQEIGRMLQEAEGQIGSLTEVIGGTCVVGNLCPAKFACIGCSGNAPDPERRYQIETKRAWATEQMDWASRQGLFTERRQMKQIQSDCDLIMEEMDLIVRAREDGAQSVTIEREQAK